MSDPYILGETNATNIVTLNRPAVVRFLAGGYPRPHVSWWHEKQLVPLNSDRIEMKSDYSLHISSVELPDLGEYVCQAYSGIGKPISMYATLKAYGPFHLTNRDHDRYLKYIIAPNVPPTTPPYIYYPVQPLPGVQQHNGKYTH